MKVLITERVDLPMGRAPARPLFAVGDVHGHADALTALLAHLRRVIEADYPETELDLVFLGDLIDRGPDPLGAMRAARDGLGLARVRETALIGNHDDFLLRAARIGDRRIGMQDWGVWLANGGGETLKAMDDLSYLSATPERLRAALGAELIAFLEGMRLSFETGDVLCAHAGVDPDTPLTEQTERDLIWIRSRFLTPAEDAEHPWPLGKTVVHGHTPPAYGVFPHRIGVDTGGFSTGVFTAAEIDARGVRLHHVSRD